ncbi:MAG: hypothetical protein A2Y86_09230 [Candidatus Aminicenantes bacterium RBG_13_62_12]|nr:MAG: hypothetical protein A2Y86_09230 [Candidatus Aminicenantes bacterium RBG_13_62_12]
MKMRAIRHFIFAAVLLGCWAGLRGAPPQAKKPARRTSPPYTVMVSLQATSPFVPDGRMSIADLAFSATFKDVVFVYDPKGGAGMTERHDGKLLLTRHEFNDVAAPDDRHRPWVKKAWPMEFPASLVEGWVEREEEEPPKDLHDIPIVPLVPKSIKLGFYARFGLLDLEWISKLGSNVLSNMLYEFEAPLWTLIDGKPVTLKFDYEGDYPEDSGVWWIEFIPPKKK